MELTLSHMNSLQALSLELSGQMHSMSSVIATILKRNKTISALQLHGRIAQEGQQFQPLANAIQNSVSLRQISLALFELDFRSLKLLSKSIGKSKICIWKMRKEHCTDQELIILSEAIAANHNLRQVEWTLPRINNEEAKLQHTAESMAKNILHNQNLIAFSMMQPDQQFQFLLQKLLEKHKTLRVSLPI